MKPLCVSIIYAAFIQLNYFILFYKMKILFIVVLEGFIIPSG